MAQSKFPAGWDEERVQRVLAHYESQSDEDAVTEDETCFDRFDHAVIEVTRELVPAVRDLIAKRRK